MTMLNSPVMQQQDLSGHTYVRELLQIERKNNLCFLKISSTVLCALLNLTTHYHLKKTTTLKILSSSRKIQCFVIISGGVIHLLKYYSNSS